MVHTYVSERTGYIVSMRVFGQGRATAMVSVRGELRLITFVTRTGLLKSPRVVRTNARDKVLVTAAIARHRRPRYRLFTVAGFVKKLMWR